MVVDDVNVIVLTTEEAFTFTDPDDGLAAYPATVPTKNGYVPFGSVNVIARTIDVFVVPISVTDQLVPLGSPLSANVTEYFVTGVNAIDRLTVVPDTVTVPDPGLAT